MVSFEVLYLQCGASSSSSLCPGVAAIMDTEDSKETTDPLRPHIPSFTYAGAGGETPNSSSESDSSASEGEGASFVPPPQRRKDSASDYSPTGSKSPSSESASEGHSSNSNCSEAARPRQNVTKQVQFMDDSDSSSSNSTVGSRSQQPSYPPHSDFEYDSYYSLRRKATKNVTYVEYLESEDSNSDSWPPKRHRHRREESDSEFEVKSESPSAESFMDESSEDEYLPEGRKSQGRRARRKVSYCQCCFLCFAVYGMFGFSCRSGRKRRTVTVTTCQEGGGERGQPDDLPGEERKSEILEMVVFK